MVTAADAHTAGLAHGATAGARGQRQHTGDSRQQRFLRPSGRLSSLTVKYGRNVTSSRNMLRVPTTSAPGHPIANQPPGIPPAVLARLKNAVTRHASAMRSMTKRKYRKNTSALGSARGSAVRLGAQRGARTRAARTRWSRGTHTGAAPAPRTRARRRTSPDTSGSSSARTPRPAPGLRQPAAGCLCMRWLVRAGARALRPIIIMPSRMRRSFSSTMLRTDGAAQRSASQPTAGSVRRSARTEAAEGVQEGEQHEHGHEIAHVACA